MKKELDNISRGVLNTFYEMGVPEAIDNVADYKKAGDAVKYLRDTLNKFEGERKKQVAPLVQRKKKMDMEFKYYTLPFKQLVDKVKDKMIVFNKKLKLQQQVLEEAALAKEPEEHIVIVDDLVEESKQGEVSSSSVRTVFKYRVLDKTLRDIVSIKQTNMRAFLQEGGVLPDWIETYEEDVISIRSK